MIVIMIYVLCCMNVCTILVIKDEYIKPISKMLNFFHKHSWVVHKVDSDVHGATYAE